MAECVRFNISKTANYKTTTALKTSPRSNTSKLTANPLLISLLLILSVDGTGADPGEVKWVNFHPPPPFSEPPSFVFFSYPSNIEIIFDFSEIITKIHHPFQNPGSALVEHKNTSGRQLVNVFLRK